MNKVKEDAKQLFETAIKINPNFANAYDNLGNLELINGNLGEAEKYLMQSLKCNSHNPTAMYHLGQVAARQKDYNKALKDIETAFNSWKYTILRNKVL